jgi:hypothetical protein
MKDERIAAIEDWQGFGVYCFARLEKPGVE